MIAQTQDRRDHIIRRLAHRIERETRLTRDEAVLKLATLSTPALKQVAMLMGNANRRAILLERIGR